MFVEAEAIEASARGDREAFGSLVERYQQAAFRAAYVIVRDAATAEDVAQDAFVRAYRQMHRFRAGEPFRPWLLRIVTNLALNEVRGRQRRRGLFERATASAEIEEAAPDAGAVAHDDAATLLRAMGELAEDDRIVLHLRYYADLPEREIAAAIGKPAGTVKSRLHRASRRLREVVEAKYPQLMERNDG